MRFLSDYSESGEIKDNLIAGKTSSGYSTGVYISAVALSENKVFIAHGISNNSRMDSSNCLYNKWNGYNCWD